METLATINTFSQLRRAAVLVYPHRLTDREKRQNMKSIELNEVLSNKLIASALKNHYVPYYIENERIFADDMTGTNTYEDLTRYTYKKLREWLGY